MLKIIIKTGRRSDVFYVGVYFIIISNSKYFIYTAKLF